MDLEYLGKRVHTITIDILFTCFGFMFLGFLAQRVHQESKVSREMQVCQDCLEALELEERGVHQGLQVCQE